ncbi:hypothetical protein MRB53_040511 [Persea americana]|nr:hypothetical protein MRB53_040511 [Persea americana]
MRASTSLPGSTSRSSSTKTTDRNSASSQAYEQHVTWEFLRPSDPASAAPHRRIYIHQLDEAGPAVVGVVFLALRMSSEADTRCPEGTSTRLRLIPRCEKPVTSHCMRLTLHSSACVLVRVLDPSPSACMEHCCAPRVTPRTCLCFCDLQPGIRHADLENAHYESGTPNPADVPKKPRQDTSRLNQTPWPHDWDFKLKSRTHMRKPVLLVLSTKREPQAAEAAKDAW